MTPEALCELLADCAHASWSHWMAYQFTRGTLNPDGSWTMPAWAVERWQRQMRTAYADLSPAEQESDRVEARKIMTRLNEEDLP
jgi:hypothetical protein